MESVNPYSAPKAQLVDLPPADSDEAAQLERVAAGQRYVIYALLVQLCSYALVSTIGAVGLLLAFVALAAAIIAMFVLAGALGISLFSRILLVIGMFIPLVSLLILGSLSGRATRRLRAAGYSVGFLGAKSRA